MGICGSSADTKLSISKSKKPTKSQLFNPFSQSKGILSRYKIEEIYIFDQAILGQGSFGQVRRAIHRTSSQERAIKIIYKSQSTPQFIARIKEEVKILSNLDHPNIVKYFEYFEDSENIYIVTELLEGGNVLLRWDSNIGTEDELAWIMRQIMSAILYCHNLNISHRDIKPENILCLGNAEPRIVKLIDFGVSLEGNKKFEKKVGTVRIYL